MGLFLPRVRAVCLALVLGIGVCSSQNPQAQNSTPPVPTPQAPDLNSLQGLKVSQIKINSTAVDNPQSLITLLPQKADEPLDKYKVRRSVQVLYDTGRFSEIQVEAQRTPQGEVVLAFDALDNYFFGSIVVEGSSAHPSDNQLVNASKLNLGEQFTEAKIKSGIDGMLKTLQENGYYQASIKPFYEWDSANQQVKVDFVIERGNPARVGVVNVTGSPGYTVDEVRNIAKMRPGVKVTAARVTTALQRLRKRFQKRERLEAQVTLTQRVYHAESNRVDYTFDINRGPVVDVKVEGAKLRRGLIKRFVPIYEESAVDEDLLNEGARNLRDYFQTRGYFDVNVTYTQTQDPNTEKRDVIFHVERNQRHKLIQLAAGRQPLFPHRRPARTDAHSARRRFAPLWPFQPVASCPRSSVDRECLPQQWLSPGQGHAAGAG